MLQAPGGFFDHTIPWNGEPVTDQNGNPIRDFWDRYTELKNKMMNAKAKYANLPLEEQKVAVTNEFTEQDYIDLAVLFNLAWIDYDYIMNTPELKALYEKVDEGGYTRDDVKTVLNAQLWLLNHTFEEHEKINYLLGNGNVEVTVVPYAHPIGRYSTTSDGRATLTLTSRSPMSSTRSTSETEGLLPPREAGRPSQPSTTRPLKS